MRIMRVTLRIAIAINVFILLFPLFVNIAHTQTIHDIAVSSVYSYPSIVMAGQPVNVSILVWNQGDFTEINIHVMVFADTDTSIIGDEILVTDYFVPSLDPYFTDDRVIVWDTTGITSATYTVSAAAQPVPGEVPPYLDNNLYVDGPVIIYFPFWKAPYPDYAPSGVPDFDQRQDAWTNGAGAWTHCGPVAVGNSLWWMDSRFEPGNASYLPEFGAGLRNLVVSYNPLWDDHDPQNVQPFIQDLAWYMDTNGIRTGVPHSGTDVFDMEKGIRDYLFDKGLDMEFYEKTVKMPTFEYIANETLMSEDVILLLGFWQEQYEPTPHWVRVGGHFVTVAGVDVQNMLVGFSDPIQDNAENGNPGRVLPFPHLPGHTSATHNDARFISHDMFAAGATNSPGGIWGPANYAENYTVISNFFGENTPSDLLPYVGDFNDTGGGHIQTEVEYAVSISPSPWFWKARFPDYAPSGMPDFDQRQDGWTNGAGAWTHCGPAAEANSLWWFDSKYEPKIMPPPAISDGFSLVQSYNALWDDHDPQNVQPFIQDLAWYMDTDGMRTGVVHSGTNVMDMQFGTIWYMKTKGLIPLGDANGDGIVDTNDLNLVNAALGWAGLPNATKWEDLNHDGNVDAADVAIVNADMGKQGKFYEKTIKTPTFDYVEAQVEKSEDVVLLLGFWQFQYEPYPHWVRVGGHFVTVAGVYSANMSIAFSDPIRDNAEAGGSGHVAPPIPPAHPHGGPSETTHNNATFVSHDFYDAGPTNSPGGIWGPIGYGSNVSIVSGFGGQNLPGEFQSYNGTIDPLLPIQTEVEYAVIISPRGPVVYAGSQNNNAYALDSDGALLWSFNTGAPVVSVATSLDGTYVAVGSQGNKLYLFNAAGQQLWSKAIPVAYGGLGVGAESDTVGISADGQYIVAAATDGLYVYYQNGTLLRKYDGNFRLAQISADGNYIIAINSEGTVTEYLTKDYASFNVGTGALSGWAAIDALGQHVAVTTFSNVTLYNGNGTQIWSYALTKTGNTHVDISWDGRTVVAVNDDPTDSLGAELNYFSDMKDGTGGWSAADSTPLWTFAPSPASPNDDFYSVDTSKYGKVTATGGAPTNIYAVWKDGTLLQNLTEPMAQVITVDLTLTGQYGASGDNNGVVWFFSKDSNATLWNFNAGMTINSVAISEFYPCMIPFPNHDVAVIDVSPNVASVVQGGVVGIAVTVQNQGDFTESGNLGFGIDQTLRIVSTQDYADLIPAEVRTFTFTWNTTDAPLGNYTIRAIANLVQDEIDIYDNTFTDGIVQVIGASGHDVAVTGVWFTKTIVGKGYFMNFSLTVANQGLFSETFNVSAYYNGTAMMLYGGGNYRTVTLANGTSTTLNLLWNTTGVSMGNYTITAYAWPLPTEWNTTNNSAADGWVYVGVPCDITGPTPKVPDGVCNMRDIGYMASHFGTTPSSPNWDPNADVTGATWGVPDGIVNMRDIGEAARNFGKTDP